MSEVTEHQKSSEAETESHKESGRLASIADDTRNLVADVKEWVDLRVQLFQLEIEERIEKVANQLISTIVVIVLALFALMFLLLGVAEILGQWLQNPAYGFLIVAAVLGLITLVVHKTHPRIVRSSGNKAKKILEAADEPLKLKPSKTDQTNSDEAAIK